MNARRFLFISSFLLWPLFAGAQVEADTPVPDRMSVQGYSEPAPAPLIQDESKAPKPLDLSAIFSKVEAIPIPTTPGDIPLELKATAKEILFVERLRQADADFLAGKYETVIRDLEEILTQLPGNRGIRMLLASAYQQTAQYARAEAMYKELIAEFPNDYTVVNNIAWMYATAQDPKFRRADEAVRLARAAMVMAPADHHVWSTLSAAYYTDGEYVRALDAARQAFFQAQKLGNQDKLLDYSEQVEQCQKAVRTMSILD